MRIKWQLKGTFKYDKYGAVRVQKNIKNNSTKEKGKEAVKIKKEIGRIIGKKKLK